MRSVLALLTLAFLAVAPVAGQDPPKEDEKKEERKAAMDADALWKNKGRSWTIKYVSKMSSIETVRYNRFEVTEVSDAGASYTLTLMDGDKRTVYSSQFLVKFDAAKAAADGAASAAAEAVEVKIKVAAGEFDCISTTNESSGNTTTLWMSKKYAGLTVKSEAKSDAYKATAELVEFKD